MTKQQEESVYQWTNYDIIESRIIFLFLIVLLIGITLLFFHSIDLSLFINFVLIFVIMLIILIFVYYSEKEFLGLEYLILFTTEAEIIENLEKFFNKENIPYLIIPGFNMNSKIKYKNLLKYSFSEIILKQLKIKIKIRDTYYNYKLKKPITEIYIEHRNNNTEEIIYYIKSEIIKIN